MDQLAAALVAVFSPQRRRPPLVVEMTTRCDSEFMTGLHLEANSLRSGLFSRPRSKVRRQPGGAPLPFHPQFYGGRLELRDQDRWRYDKMDETGEVFTSVVRDGTDCWSQTGDGERVAWQPIASDNPYLLGEDSWQFHVDLALREIVEPELMMPALAISAAAPVDSDFGAAVRLSGRPKHADRVESALVRVSAASCEVDIHLETGIALRATSFSDGGTALVSHEVQSLAHCVE